MKKPSGTCSHLVRLVSAVFSACVLTVFAVTADAANGDPTARGDTYATPAGKTLTVQTSRVSGVLYNDFDTDPTTGENIGNAGLTVDQTTVTTPINGGSVTMNPDGSFSYSPGASLGNNDNDSFTYQSKDADGNLSNVATVNIHIQPDQPDFKIMMNYELGMHCTGFEFSYCCILPPYNSIVAQVVRRQDGQNPFPRLLSGDPMEGIDVLGRETVLRDYDSERRPYISTTWSTATTPCRVLRATCPRPMAGISTRRPVRIPSSAPSRATRCCTGIRLMIRPA